ncbi:hypothetical protein ABZX75_03205 [Streptomyces sp. NPDC003038]|uniref:hypothetical protein n=1 Tax=Streptomyces sp. NPDC003038 TaxID=3154546 RepID=UPI0033A74727
MESLASGDPLAVAVTAAIRGGDPAGLRRLLDRHPGLAAVRIVQRGAGAGRRSLLHIATDWPGRYPRAAEVIRTLVAAGADPGARFVGAHAETPLHWAASNDDVAAIDALVAAGADIEAPGAVSAAAHRSRTRAVSASGRRHADCSTTAPARASRTPPPSACSTGSRNSSRRVSPQRM